MENEGCVLRWECRKEVRVVEKETLRDKLWFGCWQELAAEVQRCFTTRPVGLEHLFAASQPISH